MRIAWIVQHNDGNKWRPYRTLENRKDARDISKYLNGFAFKTKNAIYRVRKYVEVDK